MQSISCAVYTVCSLGNRICLISYAVLATGYGMQSWILFAVNISIFFQGNGFTLKAISPTIRLPDFENMAEVPILEVILFFVCIF